MLGVGMHGASSICVNLPCLEGACQQENQGQGALLASVGIVPVPKGVVVFMQRVRHGNCLSAVLFLEKSLKDPWLSSTH